MHTRWRMSCAALMLPVVACNGKSASERVAEHDRVRVSWEQTARVVAATWIERAVPDAYATRTLERASEELQHESDALGKDEIPEQDRSRVGNRLIIARALADSLERAIHASDRRTAARLVERSPRAHTDSLLRQAALR